MTGVLEDLIKALEQLDVFESAEADACGWHIEIRESEYRQARVVEITRPYPPEEPEAINLNDDGGADDDLPFT